MSHDFLPYAQWKRATAQPFPKRQLPGHCLAIMLASWRGQSLVPAGNVAGLERAFNSSRHPEIANKQLLADAQAAAAARPGQISQRPDSELIPGIQVLECDCGHPEHYA